MGHTKVVKSKEEFDAFLSEVWKRTQVDIYYYLEETPEEYPAFVEIDIDEDRRTMFYIYTIKEKIDELKWEISMLEDLL